MSRICRVLRLTSDQAFMRFGTRINGDVKVVERFRPAKPGEQGIAIFMQDGWAGEHISVVSDGYSVTPWREKA